MAEPIRLGLVLKGDDAREFEERMRNPKVSKEQVVFFREAITVYKNAEQIKKERYVQKEVKK
jgi:hypothetical protein